MSEPVNNKTQAMRIVANVDHLPTLEAGHASLVGAQVYATLHLADQTRLAALVALWSVNEVDAANLSRIGINFGAIVEEIKTLLASS